MKLTEALHHLYLAGVRPPKTLTLAITGACNLSCRHCWVSAGEASSSPHVPLATVLRLIGECAALGVTGIRITGGEPLCHPHWLEIIQFSRSLGFASIALQTNAMRMGEEYAAALREVDFSGFSIQVSLDGASAGSHDLIRGDGAFNAALNGIAQLVQKGLGPKVSIFFTEMRHNLEEIPELLERAEKIGVGSVTTGAMVLCGRAADTSAIAPPEIGQYLKLIERYDNDAHFKERYDRIGSVAALKWRTDTAARQNACTFIENSYLTPSGILYPCLLCHSDDFSVSGVFEKGLAVSLAEGAPLWSSLLRISNSRCDSIAACQSCPGKELCAGGCMGRAWGSAADLHAADDRCPLRRTVYAMAYQTTPPDSN